MPVCSCRIYLILCAVLASLLLAACGKGSPSVTAVTSSQQTTVRTATDLSGIASVGQPLTGTVDLSDSSYPTKTTSVVLNQDGTYSFNSSDLQALKAPFLLKNTDNSGTSWYSFASGAGTANINPITTLALVMASGASDLNSLSDSYNSHNAATLNLLSLSFPSALAKVMTALNPLLAFFGSSDSDPLAGFYSLNQQGLDGFLGQVTFTISNGAITITDKTSRASVFAASLDDLETPVVTASALTAPATYYLPGNAALTLAVQGNLPAGTFIKCAAFTLQLPQGITVDTGASGVNTAIPIEAAVNSNVYPVPVLSQTNNQLSLTLSSLGGFGTGNFITVRCIVSSAQLLATTTANFSIIASTMYADIYKNQLLKTVSIVPVSLVFPAQEGKKLFNAQCASCHNLNTDDTTTASLAGKSTQLSGVFSGWHHGLTLSKVQVEYLSEYLTALSNGQLVF